MADKKPETPAELSAYRCQLACRIGQNVLDGKIETPPGVSKLEYAVSELSSKIEESGGS